jgi:hypothetical protein
VSASDKHTGLVVLLLIGVFGAFVRWARLSEQNAHFMKCDAEGDGGMIWKHIGNRCLYRRSLLLNLIKLDLSLLLSLSRCITVKTVL